MARTEGGQPVRGSKSQKTCPTSGRLLTLTGQLFQAGAAGRQLGLLDEERGKAVSNGKREAAALAQEAAVFLGKGRVTGVHRTAEQGE